MQRLFATVSSATCALAILLAVTSTASTPVFARGGVHGMARGAGIPHRAEAGTGRTARIGIGRGVATRQVTPQLNAIPAPLPEPQQAPIINGPLTSNGLPSMGNGL
jgi:hypothetical protein